MSRKLAILGGGISGLSLAYFLSRNFARGKLPWKIVLFERRSQAGGWLRSQRGPSSLLWEQGTRSMAPKQRHYRALMEMFHDSELRAAFQTQLISVPKKSELVQTKYTVVNGKVDKIPTNPFTIWKSPVTRNIPRAVLRDMAGVLRPSGKDVPTDMSVEAFFSQYFHASIADYAMSAFIHGVYGGDVSNWSMQAQFPQMLSLKRQYGSVAIGTLMDALSTKKASNDESSLIGSDDSLRLQRRLEQDTFFTFQDGMQTLPNILTEYLAKQKNVQLCLNHSCVGLEKSGEDGLMVHTQEGTNVMEKHLFQNVISCLPPHIMKKQLFSGVSETVLPRIHHNTFAPVSLVFKKTDAFVKSLPITPSLGVLIPAKESINYGIPATGIIMDSMVFPDRQPPQLFVMTVMLGGQHFQKVLQQYHQEKGMDIQSMRERQSEVETWLLDLALDTVSRLLTIRTKEHPLVHHDVSFLPECIPQLAVGHTVIQQQYHDFARDWSGGRLQLNQAALGGVGVPDCIARSYQMAERIASQLSL